MNQNKIFLVIVIVAIVGGFIYWNSHQKNGDPITDVKTDTRVGATTVKVSTFYNGQNGYSLSIPSGNNSTCVWNWEGGSAVIPYSETTHANTATEKHTLTTYDGNYNYKVNCFDDFGNQYIGVFPTSE